MAPVVRISDETFAMLQQVALPLVDTPDSAIRKALEVYLEVEGKSHPKTKPEKSTPKTEQTAPGVMTFAPDTPPNLTHTSFLRGEVGETAVNKWNHLLLAAHVEAYQKLGSDLAALQRMSESNVQSGEIDEGGYKPARGFGFSVQAVEANKAWVISYHLARTLNFQIAAEFRWQLKDKAAHPGVVGRISWKP